MAYTSSASFLQQNTEGKNIPFKSALQRQIDSAVVDRDYHVLPIITPEITRAKYVELVANANKSIKIVAGEANHKLFDREDLAFAFRRTLVNNPDSTLELIFHKDDDIEKAKSAFRNDNAHIFAIKQEFSYRVHIYWAPKRPRQHYAVMDDGAFAILEQPSHPEHEPFWAMITSDLTQARAWSERFDEYVQYCRELEFAS